MPYNIIQQPPFDSFTMRLFYNLTEPYSSDIDCIYTWANAADPHYCNYDQCHDSLYNSIKTNRVILGIKDHFTNGQFNPWYETKPPLMYYYDDLFAAFPDTKFLLFTSVENLDYYINAPNVVGIVPWGGDVTNQQFLYRDVEPVVEKNWESNYNFVSLNRGRRDPRTVLLALLHYNNVQEYGLISCNWHDTHIVPNAGASTVTELNWRLDSGMRSKIYQGLTQFRWASPSITEAEDIYISRRDNDNVFNFENKLKQYYTDSCIEFVAETTVTEKSFLITEKTLNSVLGCNFPIFISSVGTVAYLRSLGLDVFDDVIDHSYDSINNPAKRIQQAISLNKKLLTARPNDVRHIWYKCYDRFLANVDFMKNTLFDIYTNRATTVFNDKIKNL